MGKHKVEYAQRSLNLKYAVLEFVCRLSIFFPLSSKNVLSFVLRCVCIF